MTGKIIKLRILPQKTISLKEIAIWSVAIYIILAVVFGIVKSPIAKLSSLGLYASLGCCAIYIFASQKIKIPMQAVFLVLLGVFLFISCMYTPTKESLIKANMYRYWTSAILAFMVLNVISTKEDVLVIFKAVAVAGALLAIYMYLEYGFENLATATERMSDEMGNQNLLGMYCAFSVCFAFYFMYVQKKNRLFYLLLIVACVPAIMFTGSRKAILIIAVAVVAFLISYSEKRGIVTRLLVAAIVVAVLIWLIYTVPAFSVIRMRFEDTFSTISDGTQLNESDENRVEYVTIGLKRFLESPFFGKGFFYSYFEFGTYTHNNYIELLLNNGIIGFLLYYIPYIIVFVRAIRIRKQDKQTWALVCLVVSALLTCDIGVVSYYDRYIMLIFAICTCLVDRGNRLSPQLPATQEQADCP